jgi:hypothetical protein
MFSAVTLAARVRTLRLHLAKTASEFRDCALNFLLREVMPVERAGAWSRFEAINPKSEYPAHQNPRMQSQFLIRVFAV